ncbi:MAG: hypothetical protein ACLRMX_01515 [Lachnospira eligens]
MVLLKEEMKINGIKIFGSMPIDKMVSYLKEQGFAGIYIDRRAYEEEELTALEGSLTDT